jgi:hypothetical protein
MNILLQACRHAIMLCGQMIYHMPITAGAILN